MVLVPALFASLLLNSFPQCSHSRHGCKRASVGLCVCFGVIWVGIVPPVRYPAVLPKSCQRYRVSCSTRLKGSFVFKLHHLCVLPFCVSTRKKKQPIFFSHRSSLAALCGGKKCDGAARCRKKWGFYPCQSSQSNEVKSSLI